MAQSYTDIQPKAGTLVVFDSDSIPHEVLYLYRRTGYLYRVTQLAILIQTDRILTQSDSIGYTYTD